MKYRIEAGIETTYSLTTTKFFANAEELKDYIKSLPSDVWYVVEYAKTSQWIIRRNYCCEGTQLHEGMKCPKALYDIYLGK